MPKKSEQVKANQAISKTEFEKTEKALAARASRKLQGEKLSEKETKKLLESLSQPKRKPKSK